jgi:hypothetical protein
MTAHTVLAELYYSAAWHDVTDQTLMERSPIRFSRGWSPVTLEPETAELTAQFLNASGQWNPLNPNSPVYGVIGRNTPIRITVDGDVRWAGEVSWLPHRDKSEFRWVEVSAGGILRRLRRGKTPLKSALERAIRADDPIAYWPLDEGTGSTAGLSAVPGVNDLVAVSGTPRFGDALATVGAPGGDPGPFVTLYDNGASLGVLRATALPVHSTGVWTVELLFSVEIDLTSASSVAVIATWTTTGSHTRWWVEAQQYSSTQISLAAYYQRSETNARAWLVQVPMAGWHHARVSGLVDAGQQRVISVVDGVEIDGSADTATAVGYISELSLCSQDPRWDAAAAFVGVTRVTVGHVALYSSATPPDHAEAATGYVGEYALTRMARVCSEEGVPLATTAAAADTAPMGPQPVATLVDVLLECARTDGGMLFDDRTAIQLRYLALAELYRQDPLQMVAWSGGIRPRMVPVIDDQDVRNDVTAVKPTGGSARVTVDTGALSTLDPPAGVGRYDTTLRVNPEADDQLLDIAGWFAAARTSEVPRFADLTLELDSGTSIAGLDVGSIVGLSGMPTDEYPGTPLLLVTRIVEELLTYRRTVTLTTTQAEPYNVGVLGAAGAEGWLDCRACTTAEVLDTTETGVDVAMADSCAWTHIDGDYDVMIGGEQMTVTAVSAVGGTSGAYTQTLTVTRSANGVVKSHASGTPVHVVDPFILSK